MQLNNNKNNTSNLIKQSESAKKKARRRLIGSIFMLFTALIILLNVTTKVKPIPVDPKVIEISSNNASATIKASAPIKQIAIAASEPINASQSVITNNASEPVGNGFKGGILSRGEKTNASDTISTAPIITKPILITMNIGNKPSPQDILNGSTAQSTTIYYIQIAASQNKVALQAIQAKLASHGIKAFIQTGKNNIFRLRVGSFKDKDVANEKLAQLQDSLNQ